jgi:ribokinase
MAADRAATEASPPPRQVLVVGSANVDVSVSAAALPRPGETVIGDGSVISVGGKGANQAVASAACGAATRLVARVGADTFGRMVRDELAARGVVTGEIRSLPDAATGLAAIYVEHSGQNCIVVVPGANARLAPADLEPLTPLIAAAAVVVLQCEVPMETVYRSVELAAQCRTPVILNPAPYRGLDLARIAHRISYLVPNETEAAQISGMPVATPAQAGECAARLHAAGVECVIITLGAMGCVVADSAAAPRHFPAHRVAAIDATGAGDAFVGCLAATLAGGHSRDESIRRAIVYAALSTTRRGAQVSYPRREEFEGAWAALGRGGR